MTKISTEHTQKFEVRLSIRDLISSLGCLLAVETVIFFTETPQRLQVSIIPPIACLYEISVGLSTYEVNLGLWHHLGPT